MRLSRSLISALSLSLLAVACGGTAITELSAGPDPVRCQTTFGSAAPTVPAAGGSVTITVTSTRDCTWNASTDASWLQISPTAGQGEAEVKATAASNPQPSARSAAVIVNDQRLNVTQEPAPCVYSLGSSAQRIGWQGGEGSVSVSVLSGCGWTVSSPVSWVRVQTASGNGDGVASFAVDANPGAARSAALDVAGRTFTVTQDAAGTAGPSPAPDPTPPAPPPPGCTYTLSATGRTVDERARSGDFDVRTAPLCPWIAWSNADWITITDGHLGIGPGEVEYRVDRNPSRSGRTGTITAAGETFTIRQRGDDDD